MRKCNIVIRNGDDRMATYEDALDNVTLQASKIVARKNTVNLVEDLYNVICEKCENGDFINELNGIERVFYLCQTFSLEMNNGGKVLIMATPMTIIMKTMLETLLMKQLKH